MNRPLFLFVLVSFLSCNPDSITDNCPTANLLENFTTNEGENIFIYEDGTAYVQNKQECEFALQYFEPDFLETAYAITDSGTFLRTDQGLYPTRKRFMEDFEEKSSLQDLLIRDISDTTQVWTNFTLQSPSVPTVADYVALQKCILDGNCDFRDNRLDLVQDPDDPNNQVLRCTAVAVDEEIVTSKASLSSSVLFFGKGDEMWFAARYRIVEGEPFTMVDFENGHFAQHPGPRIVIRQDQIAMENKFGAKINHNNQSSLLVPRDQWFTLKIHLLYSNEADGMIEIWQDEEPILSLSGINLPTSNSIQNIVEIGASASQSGCVLLVDDVRISDEAF